MQVSSSIKAQLKKPLGKVYSTLEEINSLSHKHRIIAVGDVCVLAMLSLGIRPHLAVYDYRYMRRKLSSDRQKIIQMFFKKPYRFKNPKGTISDRLVLMAPELIKKGGAVRIDGEEDLTALIFAKYAPPEMLVVYGQPHEGMVVMERSKRLKKLLEQVFGK